MGTSENDRDRPGGSALIAERTVGVHRPGPQPALAEPAAVASVERSLLSHLATGGIVAPGWATMGHHPAARPATSGRGDVRSPTDPADRTLGDRPLLRLAALPISSWLAGGSPELVQRLRALCIRASVARHRARSIAADLARVVGPRHDLTPAERSAVLAVQHDLGRGRPPTPGETQVTVALLDRLYPGDRIGPRLSQAAADGLELADGWAAAERDVEHEELRLLTSAGPHLLDQPTGRPSLSLVEEATAIDIATRVAAGERWPTPAIREGSDYLWRLVRRAGTSATPRGSWAQVSRVTVDARSGRTSLDRLRVGLRLATDHGGHSDQRPGPTVSVPIVSVPTVSVPTVSVDDLLTRADLMLAVSPLTRLTATDLLVLGAPDNDQPGEVRLPRNRVLDGLVSALADGPRPATQLVDHLAARSHQPRERLADLVAHVARAGAVQVVSAGGRTRPGWRPFEAGQTPPTVGLSGPTVGLSGPTVGLSGRSGRTSAGGGRPHETVEAYRHVSTPIPAGYLGRIAALVGLARRTMALMDEDRPRPVALPPAVTEQRRPLLEVANECLRSGVPVRSGPPHHHDWVPVRATHGGYGGLFRWITERINGTGPDTPVDLDETVLNRLGAPTADLDWPVDCLIRPLRGPANVIALLEQIVPAGVLDARFVPAITDLAAATTDNGPGPEAAYSRFLDCFSRHTGRPLVEILVPDRLGDGRPHPRYAPLWSGEHDPARYLGGDGPRYLPLADITLRRQAGQVLAEVGDRPIWPILHSARRAPAPWDTISALLRLASPAPPPDRWRTLRYSLPAWPRRSFIPRFTVGGQLVLSPAQWWVRPDELPRPDDPVTDQLIGVDRLRRRRRMPRLVGVATDVHQEEVAVDLTSLPGVRMLQRLVGQAAGRILVRELLAEPAWLPVTDAAHGNQPCVAELLVRLPNQDAEEFARTVSRRWSAAPRMRGPSSPPVGDPRTW